MDTPVLVIIGSQEDQIIASLTGNIVYGSIDYGAQFANQAAWEAAGNTVVADTSVDTVLPIPFTRRTLTYKAV